MKKTVTTAIDYDTWIKAKKLSFDQEITFSEFTNRALKEYLKTQDEKSKNN